MNSKLRTLEGLLVVAISLNVAAEEITLNVEGYDSRGYPIDPTEVVSPDLPPKKRRNTYSATLTPQQQGQYGRTKIAQWGDPLTPPQTRTRCIGEAWGKWPWGGEWRTCNQWATDYRTMQVEVYMKGIGPKDVNAAARDAVEKVVRTCVGLASVVAVNALWATPSPEPAARIGAAYAAGSGAFTGCLSGKAAELTAVGITVATLQLGFDQTSKWSKWSNE